MKLKIAVLLTAFLFSYGILLADEVCHSIYPTDDCPVNVCVSTQKRNIGNLWLFPDKFLCVHYGKKLDCYNL